MYQVSIDGSLSQSVSAESAATKSLLPEAQKRRSRPSLSELQLSLQLLQVSADDSATFSPTFSYRSSHHVAHPSA